MLRVYRCNHFFASAFTILQLLKNSINTANSNSLLILLLLRIHNLPMINDHRIAIRTSALSPAITGRELAVLVSQEQQAVVVDAVGLAPRGHDVWVVAGDDGDDVDTLLLELWKLLNVVWNVLGGAGWGEGAWEGEEDDFLVGPLWRVC